MALRLNHQIAKGFANETRGTPFTYSSRRNVKRKSKYMSLIVILAGLRRGNTWKRSSNEENTEAKAFLITDDYSVRLTRSREKNGKKRPASRADRRVMEQLGDSLLQHDQSDRIR